MLSRSMECSPTKPAQGEAVNKAILTGLGARSIGHNSLVTKSITELDDGREERQQAEIQRPHQWHERRCAHAHLQQTGGPGAFVLQRPGEQANWQPCVIWAGSFRDKRHNEFSSSLYSRRRRHRQKHAGKSIRRSVPSCLMYTLHAARVSDEIFPRKGG